MNDIILSSLQNLPAEYRGMVERIAQTMPAIREASENFYKSASQFKMATLDNTSLTPVRTIKQILAECDRTRQALEEAHIKVRKNAVEIKRRQHILANGADEFAKEIAAIEMQELEWQNENIGNAMRGAIRKLAFQMGQYRQVLALIGKDTISEDDYEREEARYHVMTAFKQAICAARAHGGVIDEGNHIYLCDLGINGAEAQALVNDFLAKERTALERGQRLTHDALLTFLRAVADRYEQAPGALAAARGLSVIDRAALNGDGHGTRQ